MDNLYIYNLGREVPEAAKKKITGGRLNGKTDINPVWRIKKLTELLGPCGIGWYYKSVKEWMEPYENSIAAFVKIELYIKVDGEWSMPIQGTGGSMFVEIQKGSPYVSDECYKMATTDAISVACKQLGIGADVYWDRDPTKYNSRPDNNEQPQNQKKDDEKTALLEELAKELVRTGYGWNAVKKKYKVDNVESLTKLQIKDCISKLKKQPDKTPPDPPPENDPYYEGLPFN